MEYILLTLLEISQFLYIVIWMRRGFDMDEVGPLLHLSEFLELQDELGMELRVQVIDLIDLV